MISKEKEICEFLSIPSIPKIKWDGKCDFATGVAVLEMKDGSQSYAVSSFDSQRDILPKITKVFSSEQFVSVCDIFIVPDYMETNVEEMDLDDDSKGMAKLLVDEAKEMVDEKMDDAFAEPKNEYYFDNIHNDEQAIAFIKAHMKGKGKKGRVPKTHEAILMKLSVMYADMNK